MKEEADKQKEMFKRIEIKKQERIKALISVSLTNLNSEVTRRGKTARNLRPRNLDLIHKYTEKIMKGIREV